MTVPVPVPARATVNVKLPVVVLNVAVTLRACVIDTVQVPVALVQAPLQPAKVEPAAGVAVSVTDVPLATFAEQVAPQLMGPPATVPVPVPIFVMLSGNVDELLKVAVTLRAAVIDTVQVPVTLVHAPVQPAKVEPAAGVAVSVTD